MLHCDFPLELQEQFMLLDNLVEHQEINDEVQSLDDLLQELQGEEEAAPVKTPEPRVHWRKRDSDGNLVYARPRSSRNQSNEADHIQKTDAHFNAPDTNCEVTFSPETVVFHARSHQDSLDDDASALGTSRDSLLVSSIWSTRQSLISEKWGAERPRLVNMAVARENVVTHICQLCGINPAAVRCCDCRPRPFFCAECDVIMHTRHVLHNRDAMTPGFYQPLPLRLFPIVVSSCLLHHVPVEVPDKICGCSPESLRVSPGKTVAVITMNGKWQHQDCPAKLFQECWISELSAFEYNCLQLQIFYIIGQWKRCLWRGVKWSGAYQDGAGLTLGEEVEQ
ncbi:hypothetical protein Q7C36_014644 [Tachysurus vachellii]|uniref:CxC2-like cysteine cluster KDZ transposase-associated domain-containing protein n=1 Tax=Tachysurus vachellii TaxID=175792 RepID=A0AA88SML9_TACVA|nr:hypothetical protein Q7C36_014644 [Tachysurus vachellii]